MSNQHTYDAILFDLDGTLTASGEGIMRSVAHAFKRMGMPVPSMEELRKFVGPPMIDLFMSDYGMTREEAFQGLAFYRERYTTIGLFENAVYPGVIEMLTALREQGVKVGVASSKPEPFIHTILEHFELEPLFDEVVGATLDEKRAAKADVIREALVRLGLEEHPERALMVGDTEHDVTGARTAGLSCVAVTYGYGNDEATRTAEPLAIFDTVEELAAYLLAL